MLVGLMTLAVVAAVVAHAISLGSKINLNSK